MKHQFKSIYTTYCGIASITGLLVAHSAWYSSVDTHLSNDQTQPFLDSVIERELVLKRDMHTFEIRLQWRLNYTFFMNF